MMPVLLPGFRLAQTNIRTKIHTAAAVSILVQYKRSAFSMSFDEFQRAFCQVYQVISPMLGLYRGRFEVYVNLLVVNRN